MSIDLEQLKHGTSAFPVDDVFLRRWSPRCFTTQPVTDDDLKTIFTAASWAASSRNEQPWRFLIGHKGTPTWQKILDALVPTNQAWAKAAPVLYASVAKKTFSQNGAANGSAAHDVGAASATASLQASLLGLHTHGMGGFDGNKLREAFAIPEDFEPVACWALGYLGDPETVPEAMKEAEVAPRLRKPLADFLYSEWSKAAL